MDQDGLGLSGEPTARNRRGINKTDWVSIDRAMYDLASILATIEPDLIPDQNIPLRSGQVHIDAKDVDWEVGLHLALEGLLACHRPLL